MIIRQETPQDYDEVYSLVERAFATVEGSDATEADYLNSIRTKSTFIPELSLEEALDRAGAFPLVRASFVFSAQNCDKAC